MRITPLRLIPCIALVCSTAAFAQTAPIKPGLWQIRTEANGQSTSALGDRLKNVPPEARQQVEAMLKQRGVDISGGDLKMCLDQKMLAQGDWQQNHPGSNCKVDYASRTAARWAWKAVCTKPESTSEGEMLFNGPEAYSMTSTTTTVQNGQSAVTRVAMSGKWLGADCGDVKPVSGH